MTKSWFGAGGFLHEAKSRAKRTGERIGQAVFNHLYSVRPDIADKIRGTNFDPFPFDDEKHPRYIVCMVHIRKLWNEKL